MSQGQGAHMNDPQPVEPWRDTRAAARAKAAAATELKRRSALMLAAYASAAAARASGSPRYIGHPCKRNPAHGGERYTASGSCVACHREYRERERRRAGLPTRIRGPHARHPIKSARRSAARARRAWQSAGGAIGGREGGRGYQERSGGFH